MYELIVFDLDGTLLDTLDDLTTAVNEALTRQGLPTHTREKIRSFIGDGLRALIRRAVGYEHEREEEIMRCFRAYYKEHCAVKTQPYTGVIELLSFLKNKGVHTAILSNKADLATQQLSKLFFDGLVEDAQGENEGAGIPRKPAPDALFAMMKRFGTTNANTLYVGDSEVDIQTAKNAGVDCISVSWGFKSEAFLKEHGAMKIARSTEEIVGFLFGEDRR